MTDEPLVGADGPVPTEESSPSVPKQRTSIPDAASTVAAPLRPTSRHAGRFVLLYVGLGVVLIAAVVGLVALVVVKPGQNHVSNKGWSPWQPTSGTTKSETSQIAAYVAHQYKLNSKGAQLVAVVSDPPQVASGTTKVSISHIAIRSAQKTTPIKIAPTGGAWLDQFCGLGAGCSITGQASTTRGRLVRREALEVALYTFKFVPQIDSVIAFMPPPPGQTTMTLLYLQKSAYAKQLSEPLRNTLPLAKPPLPTSPDTKEAATIDKLTLPVYSYTYQPLQDNSALIVLDPIAG